MKTVSTLALFLLSTILFENATAQTTGSVSGTITTSDGKPASAVSVGFKEINKGTISDDDGSFTIKNLKPGTYTIKTTYVGLESQEKSVTVEAGKPSNVDFVLTESAEKLNEVAITGYRSVNQKPVSIGKAGIKPLDNPQMVAVVTSAVITDQQVNRLSDAIKNVNGVALGTTRGTTSETFFARGYNLGSTNMFKNGSRVSSGAIPEASTLESVEVLKGSAALLYGNVSGGAVLNLVTKKPNFNYGGEVSLRAGSYNLYKPTADVYGPITKNLAFRLIGSYENAESFRDNVKSDRYYINPSLQYNLSEKSTLLLQADILKYDMTPDFGVGSLGGTQLATSIPRSRFLNTPWAYNKAKQSSASLNFNHELNSNWKINSIISIQDYDRNYFSTERIQADTEGRWERKLTRSKTLENYYNGQLNLNGFIKTGSVTHTLLAGADAEQFSDTRNVFTFGPGSFLEGSTNTYDIINILDPSKSERLRTDEPETSLATRTRTPIYRFGFYVQDLVSLSDKFKVLAGLRWSYQKTAVAKTYTVATGQTLNTAPDKYDRAFSPRVGLVYQPIKTTSLFVSYSNNFVPNTGIDVYMNVLKPSVIDQYEVGLKNDFLNGKLSANFSLYRIINDRFYARAENNINGEPNTDSQMKELAGETTSDGFEVDVTGTPVAGLNLMAGYSYNFMRYTETTGTKYSYFVGERLVGNTAHTANTSAFYTFQKTKLKGLKLGAVANFTGKRNAGWNSTAAQPNRLIPVSSFTTIDLSGGYTFKRLSLLAKVSNITNELNYYVHENYSVNPIAPRQLITTLSYKF